MTIFPISAPPIGVQTESLTLVWKQGISQSPFSGASQIINNYANWSATLSFPTQARNSSQLKAFKVWLMSLRGVYGSFLYQPHGSGKAITGKTLSGAAYLESNAIDVGGWTGSAATGLEAGDYFSIANKLYQITSVPANATSGVATITFEPPLKSDHANGTAVEFAAPKVELRIASTEDTGGISQDSDGVYINPLTCVEKI